MRRRALSALSCLLAALLVAAAAATAASPRVGSETAHLRGWSATLSYSLTRKGGFSTIGRLQLRASVSGAARIDRDLALPAACGSFGCVVFDGPASMLELADLGGDAPTALVWLWTGGAHCCSVVIAVSLATGAVAQHDFGNHGASVATVSGSRVFASVDDRFSYLYTSYAASGNPIELWQLRAGRFVDVTASYPGEISRDARDLWDLVRKYRRGKEEIRGLFAAWAADACRLSGSERVEAAARPLVASGAFSPPHTDPFGPTGARFPVLLVRDLTRFGYCRRS